MTSIFSADPDDPTVVWQSDGSALVPSHHRTILDPCECGGVAVPGRFGVRCTVCGGRVSVNRPEKDHE